MALLPLTALLTVIETKPYFALVFRGIMGAVAVLLYAVMGAPDVALTEALVGTLLIVILYAITVRSTQVLRIGKLSNQPDLQNENAIRRFCSEHKLTLRQMSFDSDKELAMALKEGRIDVTYLKPNMLSSLIIELPESLPSNKHVIVLAEHGRWHEKKMKELFKDQELITRLTPQTPKDSD